MVQAPQRWGFSLAHHPNADNEPQPVDHQGESHRVRQPQGKARTFDMNEPGETDPLWNPHELRQQTRTSGNGSW